MTNKRDFLIMDLDEQGAFLHADLRFRADETPTDLEILLLKKPSSEQYVIYRCILNSGFNPPQNDWVYYYIFFSEHIAYKMNRDLKLNIHELFYIFKNEKAFDLLDETGKFQSEELHTLYSQASTILKNLKATLSPL